jgi:hypothetical protein
VRPAKKHGFAWAAAFDFLDDLCRKARSEGKDEPDPVKVVGDFFQKLDPKHMPNPRSIQRHVEKWRKERAR